VFFVLRFFRKMIESSGADFDQVKLIVKYKVLMDNRKVFNPNNTKKEPTYTLWLQYLMYLLFGGMAAAVIGNGLFPYTSMFFGYAFLMFMLSMNMISDFSTVLFDTRDNTIIIPRPVSESTYLLARIVHIASYILGFTIAFSIIPMVVIIFHFNPIAAVVFFLNALLTAIFSVFLTHLLYMGLMKVVSGERFKDIIAYFQIAITIFMMGGYQLLIRSLEKISKVNLAIDKWWIHLMPPSWMAGSNEVFVSFHVTLFGMISIFLSILVPVLGLWLVVKVLAPGFTDKLVIMEQGEMIKISKYDRNINLSELLAKIFTRTKTESAVFQAIWKIAGRDRKFKQTIYPMLGSIFVFIFIIGYSSRSTGNDLSTSNEFLVLLYLPLFYLFVICLNLKYSDHYKSAWIYKVMPIEQPGEIVSATIKVIVLKLFLPVYFVINGMMIYFRGFGFIGHILTGFIVCLIALTTVLSFFKLDLPFSADSSIKNASGGMLLTFFLFPFSAALAGIHYLCIKFHFNMFVVAFVAMIFCWFVFRKFRKIGWGRIENFEV
jgi:ABC-2 type transport system permease protein